MADPWATADTLEGREERSILQRLSLDSAFGRASRTELGREIGVLRPAGQAAVERLAARGLVVWSWGEGKDAGVMLVRRPADARPPRGPGLPGGRGMAA